MWHRLALALGCTVDEAQERLTWREFRDWCAFYAVDPWGPERNDLAIAQLCALVANAVGGKRFKTADFVPQFGGQRQSQKDIRRVFDMYFGAVEQLQKMREAKRGRHRSKPGS